jgi:hypothetical protein
MALGGRVVVNDDVLRGLSITPEQLREFPNARVGSWPDARRPTAVAGRRRT